MPFLELNQVSFSYPRKGRTILENINLNIDQTEITAIIGPNGSGKTTLTKLMMGILRPTAGEIRLEGCPLAGYTLAQIGRRIGYVFQNSNLQLFCGTVAEEIGFALTNRGCQPDRVKEAVEFYLDYFQLADYRNTFPLHLSQGEKQRLAIASVAANEPAFLILDEPTSGLDAYRKKTLEEFLRKTAQLGRGMILVSHDIAFVNRMAKRVIRMENGRIQEDSGRKGNQDYEA